MTSGSVYQHHAFNYSRLFGTFRRLYSFLIGLSLGALILIAKWETIAPSLSAAKKAGAEVTPVMLDARDMIVDTYRRIAWKSEP